MPETEPTPPAALVRDFANTLDVEGGSDALTSPDALADWLGDHGLLTAPVRDVSRADFDLALALRAGLRAAMVADHAPDHGEDAPPGARPAGHLGPPSDSLDRVTAALPLRLDLASRPPRLVPAATGARAGLAALAAAVADAVADGSWERLKICSAADCQWAFYDASRNRSRTWCAMGVCGNRAKTRAYRARRRASSSAGAPPEATGPAGSAGSTARRP